MEEKIARKMEQLREKQERKKTRRPDSSRKPPSLSLYLKSTQ